MDGEVVVKPIVLLDVDGVVVDFASAFRRFVQMGVDKKLPAVEVFTDHDIENCMNLSAQELSDLDHRLFSNDVWPAYIAPTSYVVNKVEELKKFSEIVFVTAPWPKCPTWTWHRDDMLKIQFPGVDRIHTSAKHRVKGDILIDDKFDTLAVDRGQTWRGVLWTQPWNRNEKWDDRVSDWDDVLRLVHGQS